MKINKKNKENKETESEKENRNDRSEKHAPISYPLLSLSIAHSLASQESEIKPLMSIFQSK